MRNTSKKKELPKFFFALNEHRVQIITNHVFNSIICNINYRRVISIVWMVHYCSEKRIVIL